MIAELRDISRDISKIVSVLLHTGEVFWSSHSFLYSVSIFDMFVQAGDSGVENVGKTMFPNVLLRKNSVDLGELVVILQPHIPEISYTTCMLFQMFKAQFKIIRAHSKMRQYSLRVFFLLGDEVKNGLSKNFRDVFALTYLRFSIVIWFFNFRRVLIFRLEGSEFLRRFYLCFLFKSFYLSRALLIILCGIFSFQ